MTEMATQIAQRFATAQAASAGKPGVINLSPAFGEETVRVVCNKGADEINVEGKSYRRRDDGGFQKTRAVTWTLHSETSAASRNSR